MEELRGRWLDDVTGRLLSRLQDTGYCDLDEGMHAAARHLEAVIGIGPDELQVLHRNADLPTCSKILEMSDYCRVLGSPADTIVGWLGDKAWAMARKRLLAWNRVRSERDLFLPGLEEFDAKQVYRDELAARRQCLDAVARRAESLLFEGTSKHPDNLFEEFAPLKECGCRWDQIEEWARVWAAARWHLVGWVCSPAELQARAYFPALQGSADKLLKVAEILEQPEDSGVRMHVLQHRDWWNDLDHSTALEQRMDFVAYSLTLLPGTGRPTRASVPDLRALAVARPLRGPFVRAPREVECVCSRGPAAGTSSRNRDGLRHRSRSGGGVCGTAPRWREASVAAPCGRALWAPSAGEPERRRRRAGSRGHTGRGDACRCSQSADSDRHRHGPTERTASQGDVHRRRDCDTATV